MNNLSRFEHDAIVNLENIIEKADPDDRDMLKFCAQISRLLSYKSEQRRLRYEIDKLMRQYIDLDRLEDNDYEELKGMLARFKEEDVEIPALYLDALELYQRELPSKK